MGWRLQIVSCEPDKKTDFEFFWGREGGSLVGIGRGQGWTGLRAWEDWGVGAGQARTERFRGLAVANWSQIVGSEAATKKLILSFFGAGRGVPGRGRQRRELGGGGREVEGSGGGSGGGQGRGDRGGRGRHSRELGEGGRREVEGSGLTMGMREEKKH